MAQPAPIYDRDQKKAVTRPDLQVLEGGGETSPPTGDLSTAPDPTDLAQKEEAPADPHQVGRGYTGESSGGRNFRAMIRGSSHRRKLLLGGGAASILISLVLLVLSFLPFELIHIKNVFFKDIGGVQSRTYQLGRQRYYSRMFFFDKEGDFTGYKKTGIRGMMYQNRSTQKMVQALKQNGYQIEFEKINGNETGRVKALHRIDRNGNIIPGQSVENNGNLTRAWDIKKSGTLPEVLKTVYPDETARWNGRMAKRLYRRWGLTRTNWIGDYLKEKSGLKALENKELALRGALREHLFGSSTKPRFSTAPVNEKDKQSKDPTIRQDAELPSSNGDQVNKLSQGAEDQRQDLLKNLDHAPPEPSLSTIAKGAKSGLSPEDIVKDVGNSLPSNVAGSLNALNTVQKACTGKKALDSIVIGARVLRAAQLMRFGMSVLNIADALQNGKAVNGTDVAIMMTYLNSTDSNGHTMFASSGWRYWTDPNSKNNFSFSKFDANERNKYSVGGGFTGALAAIDQNLNHFGAGTSCKHATGFFATVSGFAVGIGAAVLSGGTFTATNFAASLGVGTVANVAVSISTEMLTPIVAGTVVHGAEKGTGVGNALVSGLEVLSSANGANAGMRPLSKSEYIAAETDLAAHQKTELAKLSTWDRLFSTKNDRSLTMIAAMNLSSFKVANLFTNPFASMGHVLSMNDPLGRPAFAAGSDAGCTDPDITDNNLAATPFCNVEVGIPSSLIDDPQYYPDVVDQKMVDQGYVDEDGNAIAGKGYDDYLKQCTSESGAATDSTDFRSIDIIHRNDQNTYTNDCSKSSLFNMYRFYSYIGQTENDGLTGNNISDAGPTTPTATSQATIPGNAQKIAQQILQTAKTGQIIFNTLNSSDVLDGSTPQQNIQQTADGQPAHTTSTCGIAGRGAQAPTPLVELNIDLLKFIFELSQAQKIQINAISGQCHDKPTSNHYEGKAVDFGCPFSTSTADSIGSKYGVSRNSESCNDSKQAHYHYSVGGL